MSVRVVIHPAIPVLMEQAAKLVLLAFSLTKPPINVFHVAIIVPHAAANMNAHPAYQINSLWLTILYAKLIVTQPLHHKIAKPAMVTVVRLAMTAISLIQIHFKEL